MKLWLLTLSNWSFNYEWKLYLAGLMLCECLQELEESFKLHRRDMLVLEFAVLVALEFALHVPDSEVYPHYQRLIFSS